jgi:hypothetical protein
MWILPWGLRTLCAQKAELSGAKTVPVASTVLQGIKHTFISGALPLRFSFDVECAIMSVQKKPEKSEIGWETSACYLRAWREFAGRKQYKFCKLLLKRFVWWQMVRKWVMFIFCQQKGGRNYKISMAIKFSANVTKSKKRHRIKIICMKTLKADQIRGMLVTIWSCHLKT